MVDIFLASDDYAAPLLLLSIPPSDIRRLSLRPLKWLRFVVFTVCGARGDLYSQDDDTVVNYDITSIDDIIGPYFYRSDEPYALVDYTVLNVRIRSSLKSDLTESQADFRHAVILRDGPNCVITGRDGTHCNACHIIPRSKGDEYICAVMQDRASRYEDDSELDISFINAPGNGILLRKDLHSAFDCGEIGFLKTPNFALDCDDIPMVGNGAMPPNRITMQYLKPDNSNCTPPAHDAVFANTPHTPQSRDGNGPPPAVLLDFVYGAAAYKLWGTGQEMAKEIQRKFEGEYFNIPVIPRESFSPFSEDSGDEPDDPNDFQSNLAGSRSKLQKFSTHAERGSNDASRTQGSLIDGMDSMNALMMHLRGVTPEMMIAKQRKNEEEEQLKDEADSRSKVLEWLK